MKLITIGIAAINGVNACYQVHTYFQGDPFAGDVLSMQAKDNNVEVCNGGDTIYFSSGESVWTITCGTWTFTFTDNGKSGHVSDSAIGYEADLVVSSSQDSDFDCYCTDEGCLKCPETESCLDDNFWNCNDYPYCALCDFRSSC